MPSSAGAFDRAVRSYGIDVVLAVARGVVGGLPLARLSAETGLPRRVIRRIRRSIARPVPVWRPSAEAQRIAQSFQIGVILVGDAKGKAEWPGAGLLRD